MESIIAIEFMFYSFAIYVLVFCLLFGGFFRSYFPSLSFIREYFVANSRGFPNFSYKDERDFVRDNLTTFELTVVTLKFVKR